MIIEIFIIYSYRDYLFLIDTRTASVFAFKGELPKINLQDIYILFLKSI